MMRDIVSRAMAVAMLGAAVLAAGAGAAQEAATDGAEGAACAAPAGCTAPSLAALGRMTAAPAADLERRMEALESRLEALEAAGRREGSEALERVEVLSEHVMGRFNSMVTGWKRRLAR
jgi:hypothetical protein